MRRTSTTSALFALMFLQLSPLAFSASTPADQLFQNIAQERAAQSAINREREQGFLVEKQQAADALAKLKQTLIERKAALASVKAEVKLGEATLREKQKSLEEGVHSLRDLFSAWKQVLKDSRANAKNSLLSHQYPEQLAQLGQLSSLSTLPTSEHLKKLALYLQHDIKHSADHATYEEEVIALDGSRSSLPIERVGAFNARSLGQFLIHDREKNSLSVAPIQPDNLANASNPGVVVIDPSKGTVIERLNLTPSLQERLQQGGSIGYAIIILGIAGLILAVFRWSVIATTNRKIRQQMRNPEQVDESNPLGQIILAYQNNQNKDNESLATETLEVRLQEIILQEMPRLDKGLGALKLLAAVAPLLGLLGTVVGMINTFQTITLVGNADPKMMAGGISQALMTTVLGLIVAVPLLFSHSFVSSRSRAVMVFLSQQSLGYILQTLQIKSGQEKSDRKPS